MYIKIDEKQNKSGDWYCFFKVYDEIRLNGNDKPSKRILNQINVKLDEVILTY